MCLQNSVPICIINKFQWHIRYTGWWGCPHKIFRWMSVRCPWCQVNMKSTTRHLDKQSKLLLATPLTTALITTNTLIYYSLPGVIERSRSRNILLIKQEAPWVLASGMRRVHRFIPLLGCAQEVDVVMGICQPHNKQSLGGFVLCVTRENSIVEWVGLTPLCLCSWSLGCCCQV